MSEKVYLTAEGAEELQRELDMLIEVRRPELAHKLTEAVAQGDLKENADYHDAKEQLAFTEGRIKYLENVLRSAEIISNAGASDVVSLGSRVTIVEDGEDGEEVYTIVGAALLGAKKGDKVRVQTPGGAIIFKIKKIG
jgi:transcription elongation factor GreA